MITDEQKCVYCAETYHDPEHPIPTGELCEGRWCETVEQDIEDGEFWESFGVLENMDPDAIFEFVEKTFTERLGTLVAEGVKKELDKLNVGVGKPHFAQGGIIKGSGSNSIIVEEGTGISEDVFTKVARAFHNSAVTIQDYSYAIGSFKFCFSTVETLPELPNYLSDF